MSPSGWGAGGRGRAAVNEFLSSSVYFGLILSLATFLLAKGINRRAGREVLNPLIFSTFLCCVFLLVGHIEFDVYYQGAQYLDVLLTPATICLAIPLYRQFALLKKNIPAGLAGCTAGVLAHMLGCILMLFLFQMDHAEFVTLLPKSITTALGKSLSAELGGYPAITMTTIMITGLFGAAASPSMLKLFRVTDPLAQGLAIGTSSHAAGTSKAVELGDVQGAASSLAIVVTGLLTVIIAPIVANLTA